MRLNMPYHSLYKKGTKMPLYNIELIHESSGAYMNFEYESDIEDTDILSSEILADLSVVIFKEDE